MNMSVESIGQSLLDNLQFRLAKTPQTATKYDWYIALAHTVRERMTSRWIRTLATYNEDMTVVAFLSADYLIGPQLGINLINLGIYDKVLQAVKGLGLDLQELSLQEKEPGLGSGSSGIFAASSMDSLATLGIPSIGYGVRYEFGSFDQEIRDGWQSEMTDKWLRHGNPWEIARPDINYNINLGGSTESYYDDQDCFRVRWIPKFSVKGSAHDMPVSGYRSETVNLLRLWKSEAVESFDFESFRTDDYFSGVGEKIASESIGKLLYPDDEPYAGKHFRLAQQYFFISCSLQDMIRLHLLRWKSIHTFSESFAVQLNDTNTSIAVPELMRLLVDDHLVGWDKAWYITQNTFSYTNHVMLTDALEKWPLPLFAGILPRHLEIIHEINRRFLDEVWLRFPNDNDKFSRLSLIDEGDQKYVRMAPLAGLGSHMINGISESHSDALKKSLLPDLYDIYPERFINITSGVTPRRWVLLINTGLSELITQAIGDRWIRNYEEINRIEPFADDPGFISEWQNVKYANKQKLAEIIRDWTGITINPEMLYDIQMKRIQEYRRQHLNLLHIITLFNRIKKNPKKEVTPSSFIFGGKASPGYFMANLIIKLITSVAEEVNNDPDVAGRINVVFFPDFSVKNSRMVYPAADISEQISMAGREASGMSSMKFAMNGALTIGTPNGTNIDIMKEAGAENFFLFGLNAVEISAKKSGVYNPMVYYNSNPELKEAIDIISSGFFSRKDTDLFKPLVDSLLRRDEHMVLADYQSYIECQDRVGKAFKDQGKWARMSVLTAARMGNFSSDRSTRDYNEKIWHATPLIYDQERA
jgi:glycogen phosphorylase